MPANFEGIKWSGPVVITGTAATQPVAEVVNSEPAANENGLVVWPTIGFADRPIRTDPTGTTVQPVSIIGVVTGTFTSASDGLTGAAVPAAASYGGLNVGGTLRGQTGVNVTGSVFAAQVDLASLNGVALGSPSAYGVSPGAVSVQGVNAFITNTPAVTLASTTITGNVSIVGTKTNNSAAPTTQLGVMPAVANAAAPTWIEGNQVLLSEDLAGNLRVTMASTTITGSVAVTQSTSPWVVSLSSTTITGTVVVAGNKTNNVAAPLATNVGTLPAVANAAAPTWIEGNQVSLSEDLAGNLRIIGSVVATGAAASGATASGNPVLVSGIDFNGKVQTLATENTGKLRAVGATMNPVIVQGSLALGAITQVAIASTTCVKAYPKAVQIGDTLVVLVAIGAVQALTITDSLNLQWQVIQVAGGLNQLSAGFYAIVTVAGTPTVTITTVSTDIAMALYEVEGAGSLDANPVSGSLVQPGSTINLVLPLTQPNDLGFYVVGAGAATLSATVPLSPSSIVFDSGNVAVAGASTLKNFGAFSAEFGYPIAFVSGLVSGEDTNTFKVTLGSSVSASAVGFSFRPAAIQVNTTGSTVISQILAPVIMSDAISSSNLESMINTSGTTGVFPAVGPMLFNGSTFDRQRSTSLPSSLTSITPTPEVPGIVSAAITSGPSGNIIQSNHAVSTGSVASLPSAWAQTVKRGNSIVVVVSVGNGTAPTVTDGNNNVYKLVSSQLGPASAFGVYVFYAINSFATGMITTINNGGAAASIAFAAYEVEGLLTVQAQQPDQTSVGVGTSATASSAAITPVYANEISFSGVALGTAAQTITPATGWINDSGQLNPITPAGLFSMIAMSQFIPDQQSTVPQATFTSEPWAIATASFRPIMIGVNTSVPDVNRNTTTGDTGTQTTTFNGLTQTNAKARGAIITIILGTVSGTLPTLTPQLQWSPDGGTTWINFGVAMTNLIATGNTGSFFVYPTVQTAAVLGTTQSTLIDAPLPRTWRIVYTIAGTLPSFAITNVFVNYML